MIRSFRFGVVVQRAGNAAFAKGQYEVAVQAFGRGIQSGDLDPAALADLTDADIAYTNLADADLRGADLTGAYLSGANLTGADLTGASP